MKNGTKREFVVNGLEYFVTYRKMKNFRMRLIPPKGEMHVSVPCNTSDKQIIDFINSSQNWICTHKRKMLDKLSDEALCEIQSGAEGITYTYILGKKYSVEQVISCENTVRTDNDKLLIENKDILNNEQIRCCIKDYKRALFKEMLPQLIEECQKLTNQRAYEWRIKDMKTKWGTCNISDRRIWLRLELISLPIDCVKFVMIHELVHFYERKHTKRFYSLMREYCLNYDSLELKLKSAQYIN